jgi:hypothetical protein
MPSFIFVAVILVGINVVGINLVAINVNLVRVRNAMSETQCQKHKSNAARSRPRTAN